MQPRILLEPAFKFRSVTTLVAYKSGQHNINLNSRFHARAEKKRAFQELREISLRCSVSWLDLILFHLFVLPLAHSLREKSLVVVPPSFWKKRTLLPEQKGAAWSIGSRVLQTSCIHAWKKTSPQRFIASSHLRLMSTEGKDPCFCFLLRHPKTKTFIGKGDTKDPLDPPGQVP